MAVTQTIPSPIKWHGGKTYLSPKLIPLLPPHVHRVHPYAGGLSELFAWPHDGYSEVVNDLNDELTNFWSVLQNPLSFDKFKRMVEATPCSKNEFDHAKESIEQLVALFPDDRIPGGVERTKRAVWFFIRVRQSRQALQKDFATLSRNRTRRGMNELASAWLTAVEGLPEVHERLKRVVILNRPALEVIKQQDGPNTFFYCDPPYVHSSRETTSDYKHEMTLDDHNKLLGCLSNIEGKFMLSGYPSDLYAAWEIDQQWRHVDFDLPNNASGKKSKERKIERVWMNYKV